MYQVHGAAKKAIISGKPANQVGINSADSTPAVPKARKMAAHFCGFRLKYAASFSNLVETRTAYGTNVANVTIGLAILIRIAGEVASARIEQPGMKKAVGKFTIRLPWRTMRPAKFP